MLKNTSYGIGEDFSPEVRNSRRHLLAFAKNKGVPYSLRFQTLCIGSKKYIFDAASNGVKEVT